MYALVYTDDDYYQKHIEIIAVSLVKERLEALRSQLLMSSKCQQEKYSVEVKKYEEKLVAFNELAKAFTIRNMGAITYHGDKWPLNFAPETIYLFQKSILEDLLEQINKHPIYGNPFFHNMRQAAYRFDLSCIKEEIPEFNFDRPEMKFVPYDELSLLIEEVEEI
jgi:hypothetical protein